MSMRMIVSKSKGSMGMRMRESLAWHPENADVHTFTLPSLKNISSLQSDHRNCHCKIGHGISAENSSGSSRLEQWLETVV